MEYKLIKEDEFNVSNWSGGKTKEIAIYPYSSVYLDRNFTWRLSSATVETDESKFSKLPNYDRVLMVLEGDVVLAHQDERIARLKELEQDRFDGAYKTTSFGKITDYNLMVEKGNEGYLDVINVGETSQKVNIASKENLDLITIGLYCKEGYFTATVNDDMVMVTKGGQLIVNADQSEKLSISVMGDGIAIQSSIYYNYNAEEKSATIIPREKPTFGDFTACVYLANIQFRGARNVFRKMRTQWFDEELSSVIRKIEKPCIPFIITLLGVMIISWFCSSNGSSDSIWLIALLGWIVIDCLIISPLIYFIAAPKPVRKHIKDINNLTPYEQKIYEKEINTNERLEKLLKKYKVSGTDENGDEGSKLGNWLRSKK